ncbi:MAG: hypothetical protein IIB04_07830, partial [Acidobacteria bacterium]|nr:hypothetical protein [Acidobacteriota bacterium]
RLAPEATTLTRRVSRLVNPLGVDPFAGVGQPLHVNGEVINPRVDVLPSHDAPDAAIDLVGALGDRLLGDLDRVEQRPIGIFAGPDRPEGHWLLWLTDLPEDATGEYVAVIREIRFGS